MSIMFSCLRHITPPRPQLRARAEMDEKAVPSGPLLEELLAESRKPAPKLPFCPAMERVRRQAVATAFSPHMQRRAARWREPDPFADARVQPYSDKRSALAVRRSELSDEFGSGEA